MAYRPYSAGKEYDEFVAHMKDDSLTAPEKNANGTEGTDASDPPPPPPEEGNVAHADSGGAGSKQGAVDDKDKESGTSRMIKDISRIVGLSRTPSTA